MNAKIRDLEEEIHSSKTSGSMSSRTKSLSKGSRGMDGKSKVVSDNKYSNSIHSKKGRSLDEDDMSRKSSGHSSSSEKERYSSSSEKQADYQSKLDIKNLTSDGKSPSPAQREESKMTESRKTSAVDLKSASNIKDVKIITSHNATL